ncbi:host attachment protein [Aquisalinus flavus]|uniref:Host attachment protein n=1 Tax=Aquisalinus flavus TaxID=1526572 RepID=A0A8J2V0Y4_9PROT|nr:host attachment family protein [Aquisalinus flavus]MBD0426916.1 host attachment protein [Aquisalinus flavus]UNE46759.1 host attachment protein [Aquisalinus flavus]GGC96952.1 host attachment protein [Aquisalinus flavus]
MRDFADKITWVLVADGEKALFFRNDDIDSQPILNVIRKEELDNPPTRDQAANRPGRFNDDGAGGAQRSAVQDTDWHEFEKERFIGEIAERLNKAALKNAFDRLVVFAPPQALGELRDGFHKETRDRVVKEVSSDLTNHPVEKIEAKLSELFSGPAPDYDKDLKRHA